MDDNTVIELIKNYRSQIEEMKAYIKKQKEQEINEIEERYENEKRLIEEKHQEEIEDYQNTLSQKKRELEHLELDNKEKNGKIGDLENDLLTKEGELQNKIQELRTKTIDYNSLKGRFDNKVAEIGRLNKDLIKKKEEHDKYVKEESMRIYDKGNYNKVEICTNKMNDEQKNFAINTTRNGINTYSGLFERAKYVKEQFESKYDGKWSVVIFLRGCGDSICNYYDDCYISFIIGEYYVKISKTSIGDNSIRLYDKGDFNKVNNISNTMSEEQKNFAIETTRKSLKMYKDHFDCVKYIKDQFESKYKGKWVVILRPHNYGSCYYTYYDNCSIFFNMGEFLVTIFKSSWGDESLHLLDKGNYYKVSNIDNRMSSDRETFAIETTRKSLNSHTSQYECAKDIKMQFQNKYGGYWTVFLIPRGYGDSYVSFFDDCYINFNMGEFYIQIFKSSM